MYGLIPKPSMVQNINVYIMLSVWIIRVKYTGLDVRTVEPLHKGHVGASHFVLFERLDQNVLWENEIWDFEVCPLYREVISIMSSSRRVLYWR